MNRSKCCPKSPRLDDAPREDGLAQLLYGCADKDREAFGRLHRLTSRRLHVLAERLLGQAQAAEEAVQEGYIKIWDRASQFDAQRGSPMTWMINIVRHQALDMMRRAEHRITQAEPIENESSIHWPASPWRDPASELHRQRALAQVLGGTSSHHGVKRACLELVYLRGYSLAEAARQLDLPVSTAKTWATRSVASARARFGVRDRASETVRARSGAQGRSRS